MVTFREKNTIMIISFTCKQKKGSSTGYYYYYYYYASWKLKLQYVSCKHYSNTPTRFNR